MHTTNPLQNQAKSPQRAGLNTLYISMQSLDANIFFLAQTKNSIVERTQNTTNLAETTQSKWKSRNNAHLRPILPSSLDAYQNLIVRQSKSQSTFPVKHDEETSCFKP